MHMRQPPVIDTFFTLLTTLPQHQDYGRMHMGRSHCIKSRIDVIFHPYVQNAIYPCFISIDVSSSSRCLESRCDFGSFRN